MNQASLKNGLKNAEKSRKKSILIGLSLIIPFSVVVFLMMAAGSGQVITAPENAKVHQVHVQQITLQQHHYQQRTAFGRIEASNRAEIGFELAGKVTQVLVDEGDSLVAGQLLAKLDIARLNAGMQELNATLARTQADLRLAKLSERRIQLLVQKNLESNQRLDEAVEVSIAAQAIVDEIVAKQATIQVEIAKSSLYATNAATVLFRPVDPDTVVAAGQPILTVQQTNAFEVRLGLAENQAFSLVTGQIHQLYYGDKELAGIVKSVAKQRSLKTRTIDVIFDINNISSMSLLPGDLLGFKYQEKVEEAGVWVPKQSLSSGIRGLWTVFVVPAVGEQKLLSKSVEILYSEVDKSFVRGALNSDDWIVINGTHRLVPQQRVNAIAAKTANQGIL